MKQLRITCHDDDGNNISNEVAHRLGYTAVNDYIAFSVDEADFASIRGIVTSVRAATHEMTVDLGFITYELVDHNLFTPLRREW